MRARSRARTRSEADGVDVETPARRHDRSPCGIEACDVRPFGPAPTADFDDRRARHDRHPCELPEVPEPLEGEAGRRCGEPREVDGTGRPPARLRKLVHQSRRAEDPPQGALEPHAAEDAPCAGGARGPAREVPRRDERGRDALSAAGKDRRAFVRDGGVLGGPADAGLAHPQRRACAVGGRPRPGPRPGPRHRSAGRAPRSEARASSDEAHRSGCLARYARQVVAHRSGSSRPLPSTRCVTWWCGALRTTSGDS